MAWPSARVSPQWRNAREYRPLPSGVMSGRLSGGSFRRLTPKDQALVYGTRRRSSGRSAASLIRTTTDPVPGPAEEPLWDLTVGGLVEVFGSVEAAAGALGFGSVSELYAFVLGLWLDLDKNDDTFVCIQPFPEVSQIPPYFFNGIDNNAHVPA